MSQAEWVRQGCLTVKQFAPQLHADDTQKLVEGLHQSWPQLEPEEAVRCLFAPLPSESGAAQLL